MKCLLIILYIFILIIILVFSILYPDRYGNVFSFFNGFIANMSAISLGILAVYQSQKYKHESDERESTPILILIARINANNKKDVDIICRHDIMNYMELNITACSLNKSISNFRIKSIVFSRDGNEISIYKNWEYCTGNDSNYNGIFLPEKFYEILVTVPKPCKDGRLDVKLLFKNVFYKDYQKTIIFISDGIEWKIQKTTMCTPINN